MKRSVYFQLFFIIAAVVFTTCRNPKDSLKEEKQLEEQQKIFLQEAQKFDISYVFDIDLFMYLDEFPRTIVGIKEMYQNESFEEKVYERIGKTGPPGNFVYSLDSPNIQFGFWGNSHEEAILYAVDIFNPSYQCKSVQVLGMTVEELENVTGQKLARDGILRVSTDSYTLSIKTKDGIVNTYTIIAQP